MPKIRIFIAIIICSGVFFYAPGVFGWGVLPPSQTHQHILAEAYRLLSKDPAFDSKQFPTLESILAHEGVSWGNVSFTGAGVTGLDVSVIEGPGPDSKGNSPFTMHYYNPGVNQGGGPAAVKRYFTYLAEGMLENKREALPKSAAWSGHFLADMHCPYHVNGMTRAAAESLQKEQIEKNRGTSLEGGIYLTDAIKGSDKLAYASPVKSWSSNFRTDMDRFFKTKEDWFDPWYYNGNTEAMMSNGSSHIAWEATVKPGTYDLTGFSSGWEQGTNGFDDAVAKRAEQSSQMAVWSAALTRTYLMVYYSRPEPAINEAIRCVQTMWRASFSALKPMIKETTVEGTDLVIRAQVANRGETAFSKVETRLTVTDCVNPAYSNVKVIESLPAAGMSPVLEWKVENADKNCRLKLQVKGISATPDLQYAQLEQPFELRSLKISPKKIILTKKETQRFQAFYLQRELKDVIWTVQEGAVGGKITEAGVFTPAGNGGLCHVTATVKKNPPEIKGDKLLTGAAAIYIQGISLTTKDILAEPKKVVQFKAKTWNRPKNSRFEWNFGDNSTVVTTSPSASHTYNQAGNYRLNVKLLDATTGKFIDETSGTARIDTGQLETNHKLWRHVDYYDKGKTKIWQEYKYYSKDNAKIKHGFWRSYNKNGDITEDGQYKDGKPYGTWTENDYFLDDIKLRSTTTYVYEGDGAGYTGVIKSYYYQNGLQQHEYGFRSKDDSGRRYFGMYKSWWENGQMRELGRYNEKSKKVGLWEQWNEAGQITSRRDYDTDSITNWRYWDNGKLMEVCGSIKDKTSGLWEHYYKTGQIESSCKYINGQKEGKETTWHESGVKKSEGHFSAGNYIGIHTFWRKNGTVLAAHDYKDGKDDTTFNDYHENGKKKSESIWSGAGLLQETVWDENGNVIKKRVKHYDKGGKLVQEEVKK